jgi:hypothetical protein
LEQVAELAETVKGEVTSVALIGEFTVTLANPGTANDIAKDEIR